MVQLQQQRSLADALTLLAQTLELEDFSQDLVAYGENGIISDKLQTAIDSGHPQITQAMDIIFQADVRALQNLRGTITASGPNPA